MNDLPHIFNLKGKTAVAPGGAGILGQDIGRALGKVGASVVVCDITDTTQIVKKLKKEGIKAKDCYIDVLKKYKIETCNKQILSDFDKVDILVSAAGRNLKDATTSNELSFFDLKLTYILPLLVKKCQLIVGKQ